MTMGDKSLYAKLIVDVVIGPILEKLEKKDISAANTLKSAFAKAEGSLPGLTFDFLRELLRKGDISDKIDVCETLLRLGGQLDTDDFRIPRQESRFQELNSCSNELKHVLSKIPDQIYDRKQFLETIKEIANSIKKLLDAVNKVIAEVPNSDNGSKQILEERKREFVRYSKKFSNTLKEYFRDTNQNQNVFMSANYLVFQTNVILKAVKQECC
ncbi:hypothetical protein LOTGIDRAFT_168922 [Lottia gigantea]|uniref:Programmed cell death protein 10 dimerisation domain-containing protein n=1 Tax=Lottia gigantea TaxID=225164 RepID=V4B5U4_LOTGI|nr:hypothetical protein LOTGIDRAFT_168922 [Lottia gigantea]ESO83879.1 hypothetical protein LOTGIDRAFT_168922 [Lottia gigantea]